METFRDSDAPCGWLRFEELPRGFVPFPSHIVEGIARQRERGGYGDDYTRDTLERHTLAWYYEGLPVAYRPAANGIEVLALGFAEVADYERHREPGVRVVQPG